MKKLLLLLMACTLVFSACKKDEEDAQQQQVETMKKYARRARSFLAKHHNHCRQHGTPYRRLRQRHWLFLCL